MSVPDTHEKVGTYRIGIGTVIQYVYHFSDLYDITTLY